MRLLESLVRLAQAHARVMSRHVVELEDAVVAVSCVHLSQQQTSLLGTLLYCCTLFVINQLYVLNFLSSTMI